MKRIKLDQNYPCYTHKLEYASGNEIHKILYDSEIEADHLSQPEDQTEYKLTRQLELVDFAVSAGNSENKTKRKHKQTLGSFRRAKKKR